MINFGLNKEIFRWDVSTLCAGIFLVFRKIVSEDVIKLIQGLHSPNISETVHCITNFAKQKILCEVENILYATLDVNILEKLKKLYLKLVDEKISKVLVQNDNSRV